MVTLYNLRMHCQYHDRQNSWLARDVHGNNLRCVCDECEHLLVEEYSPAVLGTYINHLSNKPKS
jgi:hypothetical protein